MGYNTSCIILNDAIPSIERDGELGPKIAAAMRQRGCSTSPRVDIHARSFVNALTLLETHSSDHVVPVLIGGNDGKALDVWLESFGDDSELELLKRLANKRGYRLVRKAVPRGR